MFWSFDKGAGCLGNDTRDMRPRRSGGDIGGKDAQELETDLEVKSVWPPGTPGSLVDDRPFTTCRDKDVRRTSRGRSRDRTRGNSTIWTRSPQRSCTH